MYKRLAQQIGCLIEHASGVHRLEGVGYGGCTPSLSKVCVREKRERTGRDEEVMFIFCYIFTNTDVTKSLVNQT